MPKPEDRQIYASGPPLEGIAGRQIRGRRTRLCIGARGQLKWGATAANIGPLEPVPFSVRVACDGRSCDLDLPGAQTAATTPATRVGGSTARATRGLAVVGRQAPYDPRSPLAPARRVRPRCAPPQERWRARAMNTAMKCSPRATQSGARSLMDATGRSQGARAGVRGVCQPSAARKPASALGVGRGVVLQPRSGGIGSTRPPGEPPRRASRC